MSLPLWTPKEAKETPQAILVSDLHRILSDAAIFAGKSDLLPMLNSVHLESTGTYLVASGTDRFSLGASAAPYADEKWQTLLPIRHVQTLIATLKQAKRHSVWKLVKVSLSPEGLRFKAEIDMANHHNADQVKFSFPTRKRDDEALKFPRWRELAKAPKEDGAVAFSVNPQYLARFARVTGSAGHQIYVHAHSPSKAVRVTKGKDFVGLVMPVRPNEDTSTGDPAWL